MWERGGLNKQSMNAETWKAIPGYEGQYEVSDFGRVKTVRKECRGKLGSTRTLNERIMRPTPVKGYMQVMFIGRVSFKVHQLVLLAFVGPKPKDADLVMHLDDVRHNNVLSNLKYGTHKDNKRDSIIKDRHYPVKRPLIKVVCNNLDTCEQVEYPSIRQASKETGVSESSISKICKGKYYKTRKNHYTFQKI